MSVAITTAVGPAQSTISGNMAWRRSHRRSRARASPSPDRAFLPSEAPSNGMAPSSYVSNDAAGSKSVKRAPEAFLSLYGLGGLAPFDKTVDDTTASRFRHILTEIEGPLLANIRKKLGKKKYRPIAVRLMVLGRSEYDAKPCIVVLCPEQQSKVVGTFFYQSVVKALCRPEDDLVPSFEVFIVRAPETKEDYQETDVFFPITGATDDAAVETYCGAPIFVRLSSGVMNRSTIGGIIKTSLPNGNVKLYGLTVGHVLLDDESDSECLSDEGEPGFSDSLSDTEPEESAEEDLKGLSTKVDDLPPDNLPPWTSFNLSKLGTISMDAAHCGLCAGADIKRSELKSYYDWALIEMLNYKPNRVPQRLWSKVASSGSQAITSWDIRMPTEPSAYVGKRQSVLVLGGSNLLKKGYISALPSRLVLKPGEAFIEALILELQNHDEILDGDSGSWVINERTLEVYGYVVAADTFGAGYVVPIIDAFKDIKGGLGLQSIDLPDATDVTDTSRKTHTIDYIPFPPNKHFIGRKKELNQLLHLLFEKGSSSRRAALVDQDGIGKTSLVLQLSHWVSSHTDWSILWLPALSMASFEKACKELVIKLGIEGASIKCDPKKAIENHLQSQHRKTWLVIVDGIDDTDVLYGRLGHSGGINDFLPESRNVRILFTSRSLDVALAAASPTVIQLSAMYIEEARLLLQLSLIRKDLLLNDEAVYELLGELSYLPLAITQAAAYLNVTNTTITEYLQLYKNTDHKKTPLFGGNFNDGGTHPAAATAWIISFSHIRSTNRLATRLLFNIAGIEPQSIPHSILPNQTSEHAKTKTVEVLCQYGFLNQRDDGETLDMHPVVHLGMQTWAQVEGNEEFSNQEMLAHVAKVFPLESWDKRQQCRQYLPHALMLLNNVEIGSEWHSNLGRKVGRSLLVEDRVEEAVEVLKRVVSIECTTLMKEDPSRLASQHELARAYEAHGQIKEAVDLLELVVAIEDKILAEADPSRLASRHELARIYHANEQIREATTLLEGVVAMERRTLAPGDPSRLISQHELALLYLADKRQWEAISLLKHVVAMEAEILAEDDPSRLLSQHELGRAYISNGETRKAVRLLERVVAIYSRIVGKDNPSRLASEYELMRAYQAAGQTQKAVKLPGGVVAMESTTVEQGLHSRLIPEHGLMRAFKLNEDIKEARNKMRQAWIEKRKEPVEGSQYAIASLSESIAGDKNQSRLASQHKLLPRTSKL